MQKPHFCLAANLLALTFPCFIVFLWKLKGHTYNSRVPLKYEKTEANGGTKASPRQSYKAIKMLFLVSLSPPSLLPQSFYSTTPLLPLRNK